MLTVSGAPLRVARVTPAGIEVPLTTGARQQLAATARDGRLEAELTLVGPDWEASYVLPFDVHFREVGRAWLAFADVDDALARALDRFGVLEDEPKAPARRLLLPESRAVWDVTRARRDGTFEPPAAPEPAAESPAPTPLLLYVALAASLTLALLALVLA